MLSGCENWGDIYYNKNQNKHKIKNKAPHPQNAKPQTQKHTFYKVFMDFRQLVLSLVWEAVIITGIY